MREGKPTFIRKLEQMLSDSKVEHLVHWDETGQRVCIQEPKLFEQEVLGEYFRHRRYSSFVRQLNIYGFRKVRKSTKQAHYFYHPFYNQHRMSTHELYPESALQLHDTIHDTPHDTPPDTPPAAIENPDPPNSSEGVEAERMEEKPTISELLEQISGRIEEYKNEVQMDTLIGDEVERILNQPKYKRAKPYYSAVWESPSPLTACQLSTQLEFII